MSYLLRKPSSIQYPPPMQKSRSILTSKRTLIYGCTTLLLCVVFSLVYNGLPNADVLAGWGSRNAAGNSLVRGQGWDTFGLSDEEVQDAKASQELGMFHTAPPTSHGNNGEDIASGREQRIPLIETKNGGKVVILTGATGLSHFGAIPDFFSKMTSNRLDYANKHGYDFMTVDLGTYVITHTTHPVWGKIPAILEAFDKYPEAEWIWWLDMDAIIMSPEIDLQTHLLNPEVLEQKLINGQPILALDEAGERIVTGHFTSAPSPADIQLIISQDHAGINAGSFFIRNTPLMRLFVDIWSDPLIVERIPSWIQREQDALVHLVLNHKNVRERVGFVAQRTFNAFVEGEHMFREGDLLIHFAGCWVDSRCAMYFDRFWDRRKTLSDGP